MRRNPLIIKLVRLLHNSGIKQVSYEETEHYQVMHDFMMNPKRMLDILLETSKKKARRKRAAASLR